MVKDQNAFKFVNNQRYITFDTTHFVLVSPVINLFTSLVQNFIYFTISGSVHFIVSCSIVMSNGSFTHAPWTKWPQFCRRCLQMQKFGILIEMYMKSVSKGTNGNKSTLVKVMTWRRTGDKPLHEPMLTQFTDAYIRPLGEISSELQFNKAEVQMRTFT